MSLSLIIIAGRRIIVMKKKQAAFFCLVFLSLVLPQTIFAQNKTEFVRFKGKIGFVKAEDRIKDYKFSEDSREIFIIGQNGIQLWDVEDADILASYPYQAPTYPAFGKLAAVLSFGLSTLIKFEKVENDPESNYFVAVEGDKEERKSVVREIWTGKQIAVLPLPFPTKSIAFEKTAIINFGEKKDETKLGIWDNVTFQPKQIFSVNQYKWYRLFNNEQKILIGSGDTKTSWFGDLKQGNKLEIRDIKSGRVEKELTAPNLDPKEYFHETTFSPDEKFIMSRRDGKVFVWETAGDGSPKYVIASEKPKDDVDFVKVINGELIVAKVDKKLRIYDFGGDGKPRHEFVSSDPKQSYSFLGNSQDGKFFAIKNKEKVSFYEMDGSQPFAEVSLLDKEQSATRCFPEDYCILKNDRQKGEPHRTYLYNITTGKVAYEIPFEIGFSARFSPDRKLLYEENTGSLFVWNLAANRDFSIPIETRNKTCSQHEQNCTEETLNDEWIKLSPNGKFFVKSGKNTVSLYDAETGELAQNIFDPQRVVYGKNNKIKYSGFSMAEFTKDGKRLLTYDGYRAAANFQTIFVWDLID
jgi:hypothetical protein